MHWNFEYIGRASAVGKHVAEQMAKKACNGPQESVRQAIGQAVAAICAASPDIGIQIEGWGQQVNVSTPDPRFPGTALTMPHHKVLFRLSTIELIE